MKSANAITVPVLARVEGEGALHIKLKNGKVSDVKLEIYEPPRLFEAFMRGRPAADARRLGLGPARPDGRRGHAARRVRGRARRHAAARARHGAGRHPEGGPGPEHLHFLH